jgi:hypothetical protein
MQLRNQISTDGEMNPDYETLSEDSSHTGKPILELIDC